MTLFIDSTQKKLNIALIENKQILDYYSINTNNNLTDVAVEKIMKLLKKNKIKKQQIDKIYLTIGPGSFTGVRVGCLIAKAWSDIFPIKIYTIDSLKLQVPYNGISILDARGDKFYTGVFKESQRIGEYKILTMDEINKLSIVNELQIYKDYNDNLSNIFDKVLILIDDFVETDASNLSPLYIKQPL